MNPDILRAVLSYRNFVNRITVFLPYLIAHPVHSEDVADEVDHFVQRETAAMD